MIRGSRRRRRRLSLAAGLERHRQPVGCPHHGRLYLQPVASLCAFARSQFGQFRRRRRQYERHLRADNFTTHKPARFVAAALRKPQVADGERAKQVERPTIMDVVDPKVSHSSELSPAGGGCRRRRRAGRCRQHHLRLRNVEYNYNNDNNNKCFALALAARRVSFRLVLVVVVVVVDDFK